MRVHLTFMAGTFATMYGSRLARAETAPLFPAMPEGLETLQAQGFSKDFGAVHALRDASLEIRRGEVVGLIGPNGSGKTTLLDAIAGMLPVNAGEVSAGGREGGRASRLF